MKHYEVMLYNDDYPLVYKCNTMAEAYGCIKSLDNWVPGMCVDLSDMMETLVDMQRGKRMSFSAYHYAIAVKDGEV
ncbi:hypothetical protein [Allofournierella sp.]|uniref:hypothetical protein n=1 Tax=Allofournierella sp. TaxID=1940256 RepID=UPI003AF04C0F